jgi:hypothetical protein
MEVHQHPRAHPPRAQLVEVDYARERVDGVSHLPEHVPLQGGVGHLAGGVGHDLEPGPGDQGRHHHRSRGVQEGEAHACAGDSHQGRDGGQRVGPVVPGVGHYQGAAVSAPDPDRDLVQRLFEGDAHHCRPKGDHPGFFRGREAIHGVPGDATGGTDEDQRQDERGQGFEASVPVGVSFVGGAGGHPQCHQRDHVGDEVGQAVHCVRDHDRGAADHPGEGLDQGEEHVHRGAEHGDPADHA